MGNENDNDNKDINKDKKEKGKQALEIYQIYPKKVARAAALKSITAALKKISFYDLKSAVESYAITAKDSDIKYVPHPATWFNQERWADEETVEKPTYREMKEKSNAKVDELIAKMAEKMGGIE
jgi:hypothetical protein